MFRWLGPSEFSNSHVDVSRVLLDENMPVGLCRLLPGHEVAHAAGLGWQGASNGELIRRAELEGYEILLTADKNLRYQQNFAGRRIALVVLGTSKWALVRARAEAIRQAIGRATAGTFEEVEISS